MRRWKTSEEREGEGGMEGEGEKEIYLEDSATHTVECGSVPDHELLVRGLYVIRS